MKYAQLGATDLKVSRICFGTSAYSGMWADVDEGKAVETIRRAFELGINFFDTAQAYGFGKAESLIVRAQAVGMEQMELGVLPSPRGRTGLLTVSSRYSGPRSSDGIAAARGTVLQERAA